MSAQNPICLPLKYSENKYALEGLRKNYSGGNNISLTRVSKFYNAGSGILHGDRTLPETLDTAQTMLVRAVLSSAVAGAAGEGVRLQLAYANAAPASSESADPASWDETVSITVDVSAWGAKTKHNADFSLTEANFAASDHMEFKLTRDKAHADDDYEQDLIVHDLMLVCTY